jgi:alpha-L-rhamnosidase
MRTHRHLGTRLLFSLLTASAMTATAMAQATATAATTTSHGGPGWQSYVEGPPGTDVRPVSVVSVSGDVTGASHLLGGSHPGGTTTLTMQLGGPQPVILLDYGKDVGGLPYFDVTAASGGLVKPDLHVSYSEAEQYASQPAGDTNPATFFPRPGEDPHRYDDYTVGGAGVIHATLIQGAERFERITLTTPGSVTLSGAGITFGAYDATPARYQGWFLSSDAQLNKIWYAGAYTTQLNMAPAGSPDGGPQPVVYDGAKRDRLIWIGDMIQDIPAMEDSLGSNGTAYLKQSLAIFGATQEPGGAIGGFATPLGASYFYSASYSMYFVAGVAAYYDYTGDLAFVRQEWPVIQRELAWNASNTDPGTGLLATSPVTGADWDYYDGAKSGAVTEFNALYYHDLTVAGQLAAALGQPAQAASYLRRAAALRTAINAGLYDPATGVFDISTVKRGPVAQDANVAAVLYGVAPNNRDAQILANLKQLWIPLGSEPFSASAGYSTLVSPYISGFDVQARFAAGDTADALTLMRHEWGPMVASGPQYTGTFWENFTPSGPVPSGSTSLAHGWSSGPTSALTGYVLGVRPASPGYATWTVQPQPGDLAWAQGQVPTPHGPISVSWSRDARTGTITMDVRAPRGTSGTMAVPVSGSASVLVDGAPTASSHAVQGGYVYLHGITGSHVITTRPAD